MAGFKDVFADTRPLRDPAFRRLWVAGLITIVGAQLTVVAIPAQIFAITQSSVYVGIASAFGLVPFVICGLWGGALADHLDRRMLATVTTTGLIVTSFVLWAQAALGNDNVWLLFTIFAVQQGFLAVNMPVRNAILPDLVEERLLPAATSLNMTVFQAGAIAGPMLAGVLIPFTGLAWLYFVDSIALLATLYAVTRLPPLPAHVDADGPPTSAGFGAVIDGFRYLMVQPILLMSFVVDLIAMVFGMPRALFPEIAHTQFGGPVEGGMVFALLFAAIPTGAALGGLFSGWVSRIERQGLAVVIAIMVWGFAMLGFGLAAYLALSWHSRTMLVVALIMLAIGGAADIISSAFRQTILLSAATRSVRGRLQGIFTVVVAGGPRVADVTHGAAAGMVGASAAAAGGGVLVVIGTAIAALAVPSFVRYRVTRTAS